MKTDWDELGSSSEEEEKNNESDYENEDLDNDSDDDVQSDDYDPNNRYIEIYFHEFFIIFFPN